jgi:hypothetical protein
LNGGTAARVWCISWQRIQIRAEDAGLVGEVVAGLDRKSGAITRRNLRVIDFLDE